tara:strand:+ start:389 stop:1414 length:1026 start_codon:yes stop_codon:yes gene_type:complete
MNEKIKLKTWDTANKDDADALVAETAKIKEQIKLKLHEKLLEVDKKLIKKKEEIERLRDKIMKRLAPRWRRHFEAAKMDDARLSAFEEAHARWITNLETGPLDTRLLRDATSLKDLETQRKKVAKNINALNSMIKRARELAAMYKKLEEKKFREILPELEPSRAAAWEASDAREESIRQEKNLAWRRDALGATRRNMDYLAMIDAMERAERGPDIVEAEAALVHTNEPIAVSLDAPVATRAPVLGSVVATPLTMTDTAMEALSRKRTTEAVDVRLVEGGKKSRKKKKSRRKKRTQKKKKVRRKKKQTLKKKQTRKRRKSLSFSLPTGDMLETFGEDDAVLL